MLAKPLSIHPLLKGRKFLTLKWLHSMNNRTTEELKETSNLEGNRLQVRPTVGDILQAP